MSFEAPTADSVIRENSEFGLRYRVVIDGIVYVLKVPKNGAPERLGRFGSPSKGLPLGFGNSEVGWREAERRAGEYEATFQQAQEKSKRAY